VTDKLEVLAGQGMVARFGEMAVWAGPQCSPALQAHLVTEAQRAAREHLGGEQVANSLISVLQRGDPEPQAPFAVVGPGTGGLTLFLHGPVQAWDSGRWLAPQPVPGWMTAPIARPWPLIVLPYGASPPPQSQQGNPFDLVTGVVPGSGFVMLRPPSAPGSGAGQTGVAAAAGSSMDAGAATAGGPAAGASTGPSVTAPPTHAGHGASRPSGSPAVPPPQESLSGGSSGQFAGGATQGPSATVGPGTPTMATPSAGLLPAPAPGTATDLRNVLVPISPPLPLASALGSTSATDRPEASGVYCERGHFNHPGSSRCARCGRPIAPGTPAVTGPRPPVGILLADDGSVWVLDKSYLIGADPTSDRDGQGTNYRTISMRAGANHTMASVQAEVRVSGWTVYLVDRGAPGGAYWQEPSSQNWAQLSRNDQKELSDGSHLSCGGRVLTYLAAWPVRLE
jgi:hypothetical protein